MGVREWKKEGVTTDWQKLLPPKEPGAFLPKRWIVERSFSWIGQNRRMRARTTRSCVCETSEAFILVAMSRLMTRRLARA